MWMCLVYLGSLTRYTMDAIVEKPVIARQLILWTQQRQNMISRKISRRRKQKKNIQVVPLEHRRIWLQRMFLGYTLLPVEMCTRSWKATEVMTTTWSELITRLAWYSRPRIRRGDWSQHKHLHEMNKFTKVTKNLLCKGSRVLLKRWNDEKIGQV